MRKALVVLSVLVVAAAGCSKSKDSSSAASSTPPSLSGKVTDKGTKTVSGTSVDVEMDDFYYQPTFVDVKAGTQLTVHLKNEGKASHTFTSSTLGIDVELKPDEKKDVTVTIPAAPGTVELICRFHSNNGMRGAFVVQ